MRKEIISPEFTKYHLNDGTLPFYPTLHHFTAPDSCEWADAHDHPWDFTSYVIKGSYIECVYAVNQNGTWRSSLIERKEGTSHKVSAEHIHRIISLPDDECWTMILAEPARRETHFWKFESERAFVRPYSQDKFMEYASS